CRIVGTFSPDVLGTWSDQHYHQWMRNSATFVPPLDGADTYFTRRLRLWLERPAPPPEEQSTATYKLLHAVEQGHLDDCLGPGLTEEQLGDLLEAEPVAQRLNRLRQKRIEADFPN